MSTFSGICWKVSDGRLEFEDEVEVEIQRESGGRALLAVRASLKRKG